MSHTYLLDTNTFSYIAKGISRTARSEFHRLSQDPDAVLCISAMTEAEVRFGMAKHALSRIQRSAIEGLFANLQILPWGSDEAAAYAQVRAKLEALGVAVSAMNMLIAAQAIAAGAVLVTHDKIFARIDDLGTMVDWATDIQAHGTEEFSGEENCEYIDMWRPFQKAVATIFPDLPVIADKFHVLRMANTAAEKVTQAIDIWRN